MGRIYALLGMSASGKDSVARVLSYKYEYKIITSTTTRPMRSNEVEGREYYFKTKEEFQKLISNGNLVEYRYYDTIQNGQPARWYYGIERKEIDLTNGSCIAIVDLKGLSDLRKEFSDSVYSIFIDVDEKDRKLRAVARDKNFELAEWERREDNDKNNKNVLKDVRKKVDLVVKNYDMKHCIEDISKHITYD